MSKGMWESTTYSIPVMTEDGTAIVAVATDKYKNNSNAKKLNARIQTMDFLQMLSEISKSSKDTLIVKDIINQADVANDIKLVNITKFAGDIGVSVDSLKGVLKRACDVGFLHKISTGHYMMNPFVLLSKGLTYAKDDSQFNAQVRWSNYTTTIAESDRIALSKLAAFIDVNSLPEVAILVSIANQYVSAGTITDKQKSVVLKYTNKGE